MTKAPKYDLIQNEESPETDLAAAAVLELAAFGLPAIEANISAVVELLRTPQLPSDLDEPLSQARVLAKRQGSDQPLVDFMRTYKLKSIAHAEGSCVWDHVREGLLEIARHDYPEEIKYLLSLIFLHHDDGKTRVWYRPVNRILTDSRRKKGIVISGMMGHDKAALDVIKTRCEQNGYADGTLHIMLAVVRYHMDVNLMELSPADLAVLVESFGESLEQQKLGLWLLVNIMQIDGRSSHQLTRERNRLHRNGYEKKLRIDFANLWPRYLHALGLSEDQ